MGKVRKVPVLARQAPKRSAPHSTTGGVPGKSRPKFRTKVKPAAKTKAKATSNAKTTAVAQPKSPMRSGADTSTASAAGLPQSRKARERGATKWRLHECVHAPVQGTARGMRKVAHGKGAVWNPEADTLDAHAVTKVARVDKSGSSPRAMSAARASGNTVDADIDAHAGADAIDQGSAPEMCASRFN